MLSFLQAHSLKSIRVKLITIYMLNVSDALLTFWLIGTGYFFEANLLLKKAMFDFDGVISCKNTFSSRAPHLALFSNSQCDGKTAQAWKNCGQFSFVTLHFRKHTTFGLGGIFLMLEFAYVS